MNMFKKKDSKMAISEEVAKGQVDLLLDYYDLIPEEIKDEVARKQVEDSVQNLKKWIRLGRLTIKIENGIKITQIFKKPFR